MNSLESINYLDKLLFSRASNNKKNHLNLIKNNFLKEPLFFVDNNCLHKKNSFIYIDDSRCNVYEKETNSLLVKHHFVMPKEYDEKNKLILKDVSQENNFFSLNLYDNNNIFQEKFSHSIYFYKLADYNAQKALKMIVNFFVEDDKKIVITNIYTTCCDKIDEKLILSSFNLFFKNTEYTKIHITTLSDNYIFKNFVLLKKDGTYFYDIRDFSFNNTPKKFYSYNSFLLLNKKKIESKINFYETLISKSRNMYFQHAKNLSKKNQNFDLTFCVYDDESKKYYISLYKNTIDKTVNLENDIMDDKDTFIITYKKNYEQEFKDFILNNFLTRYNYYMTINSIIKVFYIDSLLIYFVFFLQCFDYNKVKDFISFLTEKQIFSFKDLILCGELYAEFFKMFLSFFDFNLEQKNNFIIEKGKNLN